MARYIDADTIEYHEDDAVYRNEIDAMQTADVVEVVRCKDCTRQMICFHSDDYFCADGERGEDDKERSD